MEIAHGFHPGYSATIENVFVIFAWGIFGAGIYLMQLEYFKFENQKLNIALSRRT